MSYRDDKDLKFLGKLKSEDLNVLVDLLTINEDGKLRKTEELTKSQSYRLFHPNHHKYWKEIASEIQCFGANSMATFFRRKGIPYKEIVIDACNRFHIKINKDDNIESIEEKFVTEIVIKAIDSLDDEKIKKIAESINITTISEKDKEQIKELIKTKLQKNKLTAYQINLLISNMMISSIGSEIIGGSLGWGIGLGIGRALLGPIGWGTILAQPLAWIAGPAYRVTVPVIIQIAALRKKLAQGIFSVALMGANSTGKTTLIEYLRTGKYKQNCSKTVKVQYLPEFTSPIWKSIISCIDTSGDSDAESIRLQKKICNSANIVLFCYNPISIANSQEEKDHFLERLELLEGKKVFFVATHNTEYDVEAMSDFMSNFFATPDMGPQKSQLFGKDNSFYVDLANEANAIQMLEGLSDKIV